MGAPICAIASSISCESSASLSALSRTLKPALPFYQCHNRRQWAQSAHTPKHLGSCD
ncbi:unnamed protein product [Ixodes pacificus]